MMNTFNFGAIILAVLGMAGGWVTWLLDRRKHRQEVASLKADVKQKELNLSTDFADKFNKLIGAPLETELVYLRTEVKRLTYAIQQINNCPLSSDCPVNKQLHNQSQGDPEDADQQPNGHA